MFQHWTTSYRAINVDLLTLDHITQGCKRWFTNIGLHRTGFSQLRVRIKSRNYKSYSARILMKASLQIRKLLFCLTPDEWEGKRVMYFVGRPPKLHHLPTWCTFNYNYTNLESVGCVKNFHLYTISFTIY